MPSRTSSSTIPTIPIRFSDYSPPAYPVNLVIAGAPALVVGGGEIALQKAHGLLESGAAVTVVAPRVADGFSRLSEIRVRKRRYRYGEAAAYRLVIAATAVAPVDRRVHRDATAVGVPVNVVDVPELCTFTLPAITRRGDVQLTVSTNGRSPALASWLRDQLAAALPTEIARALDIVAEVRAEVKALGLATAGVAWHEAFEAGFLDLIATGDHELARAHLRQYVGLRVAS